MKLVKLFNKLSAVALATSLVIGFASCSTTTDDPFNASAPLTLEEYVKSEIKKAIDNGGAPVTPVDPSKLEFEDEKSMLEFIVMDAWNSGTTITGTGPFTATPGTAWDPNGMVSIPFSFDPGVLAGYTHLIIEADLSGITLNTSAEIGVELKIQKNDDESGTKIFNITNEFKDGKVIVSLASVGFLADAKQFMISVRGSGSMKLIEVKKAKAKGQSAPEPDPDEDPDPVPTPGEDPEPDPAPSKTPGEEYEAGNSTVTSIELVKNEYAEGGALQTQVKIPSGLTSLLVGDKVKVAFKGTADRDIGKVELMIVDTTEAANWWTALSNKKEDNFSTEIDFDFEFEITKAPIGTGANSMVFAINGLDGDTAATITCASFSIEKNADKKPAGGEDDTGAAGYTYAEIWTGSCELDWGKDDANGDTISKEKFTAKTIGLQFTFTTAAGTDGDLQVMAQEVWASQVASKLEGEISTDSTNDKNYKLSAGKTDGKAKIFFEGDALSALVTNGIKFFGNAATITKVELIETSE